MIPGSKIRNQNCSLKLLPRGEDIQPSSVRSRTFNTVSPADKQPLRRASFSQALRIIFEKTQRCFGCDRIQSLKRSSFFQTIFRSVCLGLLVGLLQTAESSNLKVLPSEFGAGSNRFNSRSCFLSFRSISISFC